MDSHDGRVLSHIKVPIAIALLLSILYAVITWFVNTTPSAISKSEVGSALDGLLRLDAGTAIAILRVLQGTLTLVSFSALSGSLELVQRRLSAREEGLCYLIFLLLSPATGLLATSRILFARSVDVTSRLWALSKLTLSLFVWLAALLLFVNTKRVTVYDTVLTYNVTAGIGPFNASYVDPFFENLKSLSPGYTHQVLPYSSYAAVHDLIANPALVSDSSPVQCPESSACDSYFLSGGIAMTTPWMPSMPFASQRLARVTDVQGIQFDFEAGSGDGYNFSSADCETYGAEGVLIAIKVCLYICQSGTTNGSCLSSPPPRITATMTMTRRRATVIATVTNYTITSSTILTPPTPIALAPTEMLAYRRSSSAQLTNPNPLSRAPLMQNWHSILAFPVWMFNANNYGNPALKSKDMIDSLPVEFYTRANIVAPYAKLKVDQTMLVWFLLLQGAVLVFVWAVIGWVWLSAAVLPATSSFVLFDSAFKVKLTMEETVHWDGAGDWRILEFAMKARARGYTESTFTGRTVAMEEHIAE
ncbi:hypothetical protein B0H66DRAFT_642710 [Apodospora peruviana]|uniref:Uncharacterized protein n=1 Tax=Apodospora peruviana TaxID=516989 RepID=A0AAE0HYW7_9PEZI|nr:hypothetical protein B0H66DRAFT_642710 [Apodospora peruviana]